MPPTPDAPSGTGDVNRVAHLGAIGATGPDSTDPSARAMGHGTRGPRPKGIATAPPPAAATFLEQLTPERAFRLFAFAFGAGFACIVLSNSVPQLPLAWLAVLPLVAYGLALVRAQRVYHVALNGTVKDSPYFLGFLLTMTALAKIFVSVGAAKQGAVPIPVVVGEAGAAIFATIVGLFFRQLVLSLDRAENLQDTVFQSALRQLREGSLEMQKSQETFLGLVQEFVSARERLFAREEEALGTYVARLEAGAGVLTRIEEGYPNRIERILGSLDGVARRIGEVAEEHLQQFVRLKAEMGAVIQSDVDETRRRVREGAASLQAAHEMMTQEVAAMASALQQTLGELRARTSELETAAADYPVAGHQVVAALTELAGNMAAARDEFAAVVTGARAASSALSSAANAVQRSTVQVNDGLAERAQVLQKELESIDAVVGEFVDVMRARMQYDAGPGLT